MMYKLLFLSDDGEYAFDLRKEMNTYIRFFASINCLGEIYILNVDKFTIHQIDDIRRVIFDYYMSDFKDFILTKNIGSSCKLILRKDEFLL